MLYVQDVTAAESFRIFCGQATGELRAAREVPATEPAVQEGTVEDIPATSGVHQGGGAESGLVEIRAVGGPCVAAECALGDDEELSRGAEEHWSDGVKVGEVGALFGKVAGDDAEVAGLEEIADGLPKAPCAAVEGDLDALGLGMQHSGAGGVFMSSIEVQKRNTFQCSGNEHRLGCLGGKEDNLPDTVTLTHEDDRACLRPNGIHEGTLMSVGRQNGQRGGHGTTQIQRMGGGLRHTLGRGKLGDDVELVECLRANAGHFERNCCHTAASFPRIRDCHPPSCHSTSALPSHMSTPISSDPTAPWYKQMSGYHWFVLIVASAAWFFDCLDQRLFSLARVPALVELMKLPPSDPGLQAFGKEVTAWFLVGWGIGGLIFGALGDKFGRARMLTLTILIYSAFTGLSYFSRTAIDFTIFRFLTGVGVGGVFGLAVALIAETVPAGARVQCLGLLQILSTIGNISAGFAKIGIDSLEANGTIHAGSGWRWMFLIGAAPAVLIIFTRKYLKEPESWQRLKDAGLLPKGSIFAPYSKLLASKRWRKNLFIGAVIASTGVIGLWAIGEYAVDLQKVVFKQHFEKAGVAADKIAGEVNNAISIAYLFNMLGAGVGMTLFTNVAKMGRRFAFFIGFTAALVITFLVYQNISDPVAARWMMFLMGAAQLSVFAGFAIYLPELFPNSLRSTGTSFCYNLGRFAAAGGSFFSATLTSSVFGKYAAENPALPLRYAAMTMCAIFLMGIFVLLFAPETKGKPLPEDD